MKYKNRKKTQSAATNVLKIIVREKKENFKKNKKKNKKYDIINHTENIWKETYEKDKKLL